jgi:hypothetical protein
MQSKLSNYGRKQKPGKTLSLTLLLISAAILISILVLDSLYSARLTETGLRINTTSRVTAYIETLSDNIRTIEQDVESLNPVPAKIVKQDLKLVDLIEKGTDSSMLDIDFTYIARLRNYHRNLLPGKPSGAAIGGNTSEVDDALYQSFSGAQRSLETLHVKRAGLNGALTSIRAYKKAALISTGVFLFIYVMLTFVIYKRFSGRETEEFIPSKAAAAEHRIAS